MIVKLTAADGSLARFDGPPPEVDDRVEVIIHQDTRTDPAVRVFVFRGRTRDLSRPDRAFVRVFSEVPHLHAQVATPTQSEDPPKTPETAPIVGSNTQAPVDVVGSDAPPSAAG